MPGLLLDDPGMFHPKFIVLDDVAAVVGSANLSGKALGIGQGPHNIELSIGFSGHKFPETVEQLVQFFDQWWEKASPLSFTKQCNEQEEQIMEQPDYVVFRNRPSWGIAQVQVEGNGLFGQEQWLAVSDISPEGPERLPARIKVPDEFIESVGPEPVATPAARVSEISAAIDHTKEHFQRLAAYWLQAENRQGQLDSLPVLQLRHQTSLVEYLSRPDAPREVLIADEVGLGKTVEIGLLLARLRAANPGLRILYLTPGGLVTNVVEEFKNMGIEDLWVFGNSALDEEKYPAARLGRQEHDPRVVASLHRLGLKSNADAQLKETQWDVLIADECHRLRLYGKKAQEWFRLVERIVNKHLSDGGRIYFLSGTPHQGNRDVFLNLVAMMCRLGRHATQSEQERALAGRVIYRTKEEVQDWENRPVFPKRSIREPQYAENPQEYNNLLKDITMYFDWLQRTGGGAQRRALGFVKSQALQYAASSPKAGFAFLLRRLLRYFDCEVDKAKLLKWVGLLIPYRHWSRKQKPESLLDELRKSVLEVESDDEGDGDLGSSVGPESSEQRRQEDMRKLVSLLERYASLLSKPEANAKFKVLMNRLLEIDEPVVVFAQSVDTVYEIKRHVEHDKIPCCLIVGGQEPAERRRMIQQFTNSGRLGRRVLVSSSAGGEGINLQISRHLIHFDLPWNPMVLEQRIGRVHRIGSIDTVVVDTILLKDSREADIYARLMQRLWAIVTDLTQDEAQKAQYFRRIMAGIPLEKLRELYGGDVGDESEAIGRAVDAGKAHVDQVDTELRRHRVAELPEDRGRAKMQHLTELLERAGKIAKSKGSVEYSQVEFDEESKEFQAVKKSARQFSIRDGRENHGGGWLVFDREAASRAPSVPRKKSGGIDHPIVAIALQSIRTPEAVDCIESLEVGVGSFDREDIELLSGVQDEPVAILSYVTARLSGGYYFDHNLQFFALSPSSQNTERIGREDGELIERIIWNNLRKEGMELTCPKLSAEFCVRLSEEDSRIRQELSEEFHNESGRWIGAVWPIAATVLTPE